MKTILHELAHSPFCIPVKRILESWSIEFASRQVSPWDRRSLIELTGGAYYQVPVLEHGSAIIYETESDPLAVAHFLDNQFCGQQLFPEHSRGIQEVVIEHIESTLEGIGFRLSDPYVLDRIPDRGERVMTARHKERLFGAGCVESWKRNAEGIARAFEAGLINYERRLGTLPYLFGESPVYADFALFGVVGNAEYDGPYEICEEYVNMKRWQKSMANFSANGS